MSQLSRCIVFVFFLFFFIEADGASLLDVYKKGVIKLNACREYGMDSDWDDLFYDHYKWMTVAPDGSIFVTNSHQHTIYKFNPKGKLVNRFGRKGTGPGDVYAPSHPSILDGRFLAIGEYASHQRISLFDLSGNFIKVLKTLHTASSPLALKNGKLAYISKNNDVNKNLTSTSIYIKDTLSEKEKMVLKIETPYIFFMIKGLHIVIGNFKGSAHVTNSQNGNLIVGVSNSPLLKIYSPEGGLIKSFNLKINAVPVTDGYIKQYKKQTLKRIAENPNSKRRIPGFNQMIESIDFKSIFDKNLPYYEQILTDSVGNILVFKESGCLHQCKKIFQVYSSEGKYICETRIDEGEFVFPPPNRRNIAFTSKGIFGLFGRKNCDDICLRLVKVNIE